MRIKHFVKVATNIKYHTQGRLKWWQKFMYNPPKAWVSLPRHTSAHAKALEVPSYVLYGVVFEPYQYDVEIVRGKQVKDRR